MKRLLYGLAIFSLHWIFSGSAFSSPADKNVLYQISTVNALLEGVLDGVTDIQTLKAKGDFGLGTFDALDGEMVVLDGVVYQIKEDGTVSVAADSMKTPFSSVLFFESSKTVTLDGPFVFSELAQKLDPLLSTPNIIYAVKIEGVFDYVKTRSVPRQKKPYPSLTEIVKTQPTFEFHNVKGTFVGFRFPEYMGGLNVPDYHIHFITADRKGGGHVLDWQLGAAKVQIAQITDLEMSLPRSKEFYEAPLSGSQKTDLMKVEH
ncbi:MAG TPA: acetolactate decarboxylase [bacterium]|nr:acetolactate decarboxylase [bacterium]